MLLGALKLLISEFNNQIRIGMSRISFQRITEQAGTGVKILLLAVVVLGLATGAFWFSQRTTVKNPGAAGSGGLSDGTRTVLKNLDSPVTIRFYSLLDKASVPAATFAFAERINNLLAEYQQAGDGKISVMRFQKNSDADAASADGIKPFNLDKGYACYLGLSVSCKGQKESFPQLSTDWETALEADLSRAIARLSASQPSSTASVVAGPAAPNAVAVADLKFTLTNLADISVEDGSQILRVAAFQDYQTVAAKMETKVAEARQHLADSQNGGSETDRQAARKQLQSVETEQMEKLKQIATQLQSRITTLEQIKKP
jgi:hypothetical protein